MIIALCVVCGLAGILFSILLSKSTKESKLSLIIKFALDIAITTLGVFIALYFSNKSQENAEIDQAISICNSAIIETNSVKQDISSDLKLISTEDNINITSDSSITVYSIEMLMQNQLTMAEFAPDTYATIYHFQKNMVYIVPAVVNYKEKENGPTKIQLLENYEKQLTALENKLRNQAVLLKNKKSIFVIN